MYFVIYQETHNHKDGELDCSELFTTFEGIIQWLRMKKDAGKFPKSLIVYSCERLLEIRP